MIARTVSPLNTNEAQRQSGVRNKTVQPTNTAVLIKVKQLSKTTVPGVLPGKTCVFSQQFTKLYRLLVHMTITCCY